MLARHMRSVLLNAGRSGKGSCGSPRFLQELLFVDKHPHSEKQQAPFKGGFIKLAGVARQRAAGWQYKGPRHIGDPTPQLVVDEVGKPAEEQADRRGAGNEVEKAQCGELA